MTCVATEWVARRRLPSAMGRARTQFLVINQGGHPVYHDDTNPSAWEAATQASTQSPRETPPPLAAGRGHALCLALTACRGARRSTPLACRCGPAWASLYAPRGPPSLPPPPAPR